MHYRRAGRYVTTIPYTAGTLPLEMRTACCRSNAATRKEHASPLLIEVVTQGRQADLTTEFHASTLDYCPCNKSASGTHGHTHMHAALPQHRSRTSGYGVSTFPYFLSHDCASN